MRASGLPITFAADGTVREARRVTARMWISRRVTAAYDKVLES